MEFIIEKVNVQKNNMKSFIWKIKEFGLKIALDDVLISFTKWFLNAKRLQITYFK